VRESLRESRVRGFNGAAARVQRRFVEANHPAPHPNPLPASGAREKWLRRLNLSDRHIAPVRNGLVIRSWPMLEPGPWPQMKPTSSPSGSSLSVIDLINVA